MAGRLSVAPPLPFQAQSGLLATSPRSLHVVRPSGMVAGLRHVRLCRRCPLPPLDLCVWSTPFAWSPFRNTSPPPQPLPAASPLPPPLPLSLVAYVKTCFFRRSHRWKAWIGGCSMRSSLMFVVGIRPTTGVSPGKMLYPATESRSERRVGQVPSRWTTFFSASKVWVG